MIIEKIIGNVFDLEDDNLKINWLDMPFDHAHKRIQRFEFDGKDFGVKLSEEDRVIGLKHGDIIYKEGDVLYAINIEEEECLSVHMPDMESMVNVSYVIGNRHAKLYWSDDRTSLLTPYEKTIEEMLSHIKNITMYKKVTKLLPKNNLMSILPQGGTVGHDHDHDYHHDHDHHHDHHHDHGHHHDHE